MTSSPVSTPLGTSLAGSEHAAFAAHQTEALWGNLHTTLHQRLLARVHRPDLVEDVLQDTFLKVHDRIDEMTDVEHIDRWIYRVAHNALIDRLRKDQVRAGPDLSEVEPVTGAPEVDNFNREVEGWLRNFIEVLPETYREAVRLHEVEGLTQREVGERLGLTLSGAKSRIQRGRAELKRLLLDCCHVEFDRRGNVVDVRARGLCCTEDSQP